MIRRAMQRACPTHCFEDMPRTNGRTNGLTHASLTTAADADLSDAREEAAA